jgi:hypothetical protein
MHTQNQGTSNSGGSVPTRIKAGGTIVSGETNNEQRIALSLPISVVAAGILLGLAVTTYILVARSEGEGDETEAEPAKGVGRRVGFTALATLIENDSTRKIIVAGLKALARGG